MSNLWPVLLSRMENHGIVDGDYYAKHKIDLQMYEDMKYLQPIEPGMSASCDCCSFEWFDVVWLKDADQNDRAFICCAECGPQEIDSNRLKRWQLNKTFLLEQLMRTLEFAGSPLVVVPDLIWLLGQRDGIEYIYVQRAGLNDLRTIASTLSQHPKSVVLTSRSHCVEAMTIVLSQPCIALETISSLCDDGTVTIDEEVIAEHIKVAFPESSIPPYEFRKKGDMWVIRFAGEDMYLKDSVGLRCIGQLLAKPNDPVFVSDLKMIADGQNPQNFPAPASSGEVADKQYLKDIAKNYLTLQTEYEEAKKTGEVVLANELKKEMEKLMTFLQEAKGFGGRTKELSGQLSSIRVSIYQAMGRTLESIRVELSDCFDHLESHISTGLVLNYVPDNSISWIT